MTRILAIEPNPERGALLRRMVGDAVDAEVLPVTSAKAALAVMETHRPDVILTSSILSPQDDRELVSHLRQTPALRHLPVLTVPPVTEPPPTDNSLLARLRRRRQPSFWPSYDFDAVVSRIEDAIADSRWAAAHAPHSAPPEIQLVEFAPAAARGAELADSVPDAAPAAGFAHFSPDAGRDDEFAEFAPQADADSAIPPRGPMRLRKRARRWEGWQLSWLSTVKLPSGFELRLVNISTSGLLVESNARIALGTRTSFDLWGPYRKITVPARIVRSDIGVVDSSGVRYHAAAVFEHAIDTMMPAEDPIDVGTQLHELVSRVLDRATGGVPPRELRTEFEAGVMALVSVRDVRLREIPSATEHGPESIYFTVPDAATSAVLQVTFDPGYEPQQKDLETLKAAAAAAARMLDVTEPLHLFRPEAVSAPESRPTE